MSKYSTFKQQPLLSLTKLIKISLSKIDSDSLLMSYSQSKYFNKISEKGWQAEMLKSISKCLPEGIYVSSEVGRVFCDDGSVDFYIPAYNWAIELLIGGIGLEEHYSRFLKGIIFYKQLDSIVMDSMVIEVKLNYVNNIFLKYMNTELMEIPVNNLEFL